MNVTCTRGKIEGALRSASKGTLTGLVGLQLCAILFFCAQTTRRMCTSSTALRTHLPLMSTSTGPSHSQATSGISSSISTASVVSTSFSSEPTAWGAEHDRILIDWGDKAMCYRWLHNRANDSYTQKNMWFTIPVIIISTLTGTANFAQEHFPDSRSLVAMVIGSFNIFAAIMTTIQQFLKISEVNEAHRVASLSWDKFYRGVRLTLAKKRSERMPVHHQLKVLNEEFDRMMELSPPISQSVVAQFHKEFHNQPGYSSVIKPDICGQLQTIANFCHEEDPDDLRAMDQDIDPAQDVREEFRRVRGRSPLQAELTVMTEGREV